MGDQRRWKGGHLIKRVIRTALLIACFSCLFTGAAVSQSGGKSSASPPKSAPDTSAAYIPSARSVSKERFETAHNSLLDADRMQFERPVEEIDTAQIRNPSRFSSWIAGLINTLGTAFQAMFYIGVAAIAAGVLYFILRHIPDIRLRGKGRADRGATAEDHTISNVRPDEQKARAWLEEADALAKQGRFSEAVHLLLFRSIEDIQTQRKAPIPQALTTREIERLDGLPARPRKALRPIISLVERSFFGGHPVNAENWTAAREAYEAFAFGEAWT